MMEASARIEPRGGAPLASAQALMGVSFAAGVIWRASIGTPGLAEGAWGAWPALLGALLGFILLLILQQYLGLQRDARLRAVGVALAIAVVGVNVAPIGAASFGMIMTLPALALMLASIIGERPQRSMRAGWVWGLRWAFGLCALAASVALGLSEFPVARGLVFGGWARWREASPMELIELSQAEVLATLALALAAMLRGGLWVYSSSRVAPREEPLTPEQLAREERQVIGKGLRKGAARASAKKGRL